MSEKLSVLGTELLLTQKKLLIDLVNKNILEKRICNIVACDFRQILFFFKNSIHKQNTIFYPDSSGMFFLLKIFYRDESSHFKRLISTDFHCEVLKIASVKNYKLFLFGDTSEVLGDFIDKTKKTYKGLNIVGFLNGYDNLHDKDVIPQINMSQADILLIGLGVPKQEKWLLKNNFKLTIPVRITVGAFFTFYSSRIKRAPFFMRKLYLEWFYRLIKEPIRLFPRYFIQFPKLFILVMREKWKK